MINVRNSRLLKRFGKRIHKLRTEAGLTQEKLANDADMPISQIGRIERGEVNPTLSTLNALSSALKIPLHELMRL